MIASSDDRTVYDNGFQRDFGFRPDGEPKGRMDLLPWEAIRQVSIHSEYGAMKYDPGNIKKGCPQWSLYSSGLRHISKVLDPEADDPEDTKTHLRAACWNFLWALEQYVNGKADEVYEKSGM